MMMKPTVEWMSEQYNTFNRELFGGRLGDCSFALFTSGIGSQGNRLGQFAMRTTGLKAEYRGGRMFKYVYGSRVYVDKDNFVAMCNPTIELNGNYSATQEGWIGTLIHEMCHYADYMYGYCPKQGHGPSFREIASVVSARSNGRFSIKRLASA